MNPEMARKRKQLDTAVLRRLLPPASPALKSPLNMDGGDVLTEILLRLPVKSVIRFKSVSKKWLSLISSDHFCHQHTLRRPKLQQSLILQAHIPPLLYFNPTINEATTTTPYTLSVPDHHILQSCNGLMLLNSSASGLERSYYVYNPTTRRSRKISFPDNDKYPYIAGLSLAFDPSKSPHYKIVCMRSPVDVYSLDTDNLLEDHPSQIEVYDSESRSWKQGPEPSMRLMNLYMIHCNGIIYWNHDHCYYDMDEDEMVLFRGPPTPDCNHWCYGKTIEPNLQELNGKLFYFDLIECGYQSIALWELDMKEGKPCDWLLDYHELIPNPNQPSLVRRSRNSILRLMDMGMGSLLIHRDGKIMVHRFGRERCEELFDITSQPFYQPRDHRFELTALQFGQSLALV